MEKYFLGICIVIASLIYVWGNQWEVKVGGKSFGTKYNRITGETKIAAQSKDGGLKFITLPDSE